MLQYIVADILSKWEKYEAHGINPDGGQWMLVFKLFSFYDARAASLTKTEQEFLFEQAFESVMDRRYPAEEDTKIKLAAYRTQACGRGRNAWLFSCFTQFLVGDYEDGAYISDLIKVHPAQQPQLLGDTGALGTLKKAGTLIKGTLRGFGTNTLRRLKGETLQKTGTVNDAELAKIKDKIVAEWKRLKVGRPVSNKLA